MVTKLGPESFVEQYRKLQKKMKKAKSGETVQEDGIRLAKP